jgi:hypothetical protein
MRRFGEMGLNIQFNTLRDAFEFSRDNRVITDASTKSGMDLSWYGDYQYDEFIDHFFNFKVKGVDNDKISSMQSKIEKKVMEELQKLSRKNIFTEERSLSGANIDVGRYLENDPYCMVDFKNKNNGENTFIIGYQSSVNYDDSERLKTIGEFVYCLNNILKNRSFMLYSMDKDESYDGDKVRRIIVPIISSSSVNIPIRSQLCLLNPLPFFRRVLFGVQEGLEHEIKKIFRTGKEHGNGYGRAREVKKEDFELFGIKPNIVINNSFKIDDIDKAISKIINSMVVDNNKEELIHELW